MKNILVIGPHPDDEILGCGGLIRKKIENDQEVFVLIATKGSPQLYSEDKIKKVREEAKEAHTILGVKDTLFFDYYAPDLDLVSQAEISRSLSEIF